jgi:hypothetical protein
MKYACYYCNTVVKSNDGYIFGTNSGIKKICANDNCINKWVEHISLPEQKKIFVNNIGFILFLLSVLFALLYIYLSNSIN